MEIAKPTELKKIGDSVTFLDEYKVERPALVTAVWGLVCLNLVFVSGDESRTDSYGRQIEHKTSVGHLSNQVSDDKTTFFGNCWK